MRPGLSAIAAKGNITAQWIFEVDSNYWTFGNPIIYDSNTYSSKVDESFAGIKEKNTRYGDRMIAPNTTEFSVTGDKTDFNPSAFVGEDVLISLLDEGSLIFAWRFSVKSCSFDYGKFNFTCEDFLQKYLFQNYYPNTDLLNGFNDTTAIFEGPDNAVIPQVFGTAYAPLRMIPDSGEWFYVLGATSGTYTIDEISSPTDFDQNSIYAPPTYSFTQSILSGLQVFANDIGASGSNAPFGKSGKLYDLPTKFSNSLTASITNPADIISYILQVLGVPLAQIDSTGTFATTKAALTTLGITYNYCFTTKEDALTVLCELLESCNCIMPRSDVVQLILLEDDTAVKTIDRENILDLKFSEKTYTEDFDGGYATYYTGVQDGDPSEIAVAINGTSYSNISAEKVLYKYTYDTEIIQKLSIIDYRRKFLQTGTVSFSSNHSMLEPYLGDRLTISDDLYEDYENVYVDQITIKADLKFEFSLDAYSETIGDLTDYNPDAVIKTIDASPYITPLSDRWYKTIYIRSATTPATPTGDSPAGWTETIPTGTADLYLSRAWFGNDGTLLDGEEWTTPVKQGGIDGTDGDTGPGLTYTGDWLITKQYYKTSVKQDVVLYDGDYYACVVSNIGELTSNTTYWSLMASFESVATDILLAVDATILKNLVIGATDTGAHLTNSAVRSGQTDYDTGNGWFLGRSGSYPKFSLKNASGQFLRFGNNNLEVSGLTVTAATGIDNFTDSGDLASQDRADLDYTDGADVTAASDFVTSTYPTDQAALEAAILDGKLETWYVSTDPSTTWSDTDASHTGDMWWNTSTNQLKRWQGTAWTTAIEDQKAIDAYSNAATAQSTADGKIVSFYQTTAPTAEGMGDIWYDTDDSNAPYRWSGAVWISVENPTSWANVGDASGTKPTDNADVTKTVIDDGLITTGRISNNAVLSSSTLDINFNTAKITVNGASGLEIAASGGITILSGGTIKFSLTASATMGGSGSTLGLNPDTNATGRLNLGTTSLRWSSLYCRTSGSFDILAGTYGVGTTTASYLNMSSALGVTLNYQVSGTNNGYLQIRSTGVDISGQANALKLSGSIVTQTVLSSVPADSLLPSSTVTFYYASGVLYAKWKQGATAYTSKISA